MYTESNKALLKERRIKLSINYYLKTTRHIKPYMNLTKLQKINMSPVKCKMRYDPTLTCPIGLWVKAAMTYVKINPVFKLPSKDNQSGDSSSRELSFQNGGIINHSLSNVLADNSIIFTA